MTLDSVTPSWIRWWLQQVGVGGIDRRTKKWCNKL